MNGKDSDSCIIATGSNDKCIRIYRVDSKEMSPPMKGHTGFHSFIDSNNTTIPHEIV
jgi:hypothetical protein